MAREQTKVLVVDDEETVRNLLQRLLSEAGYEVATAANGEEALYHVSQGGINVVLLDVKMPGTSGTEVLAKITAEYPDVCVLMVTAVVEVQTAVKTLKLGAYDYITKPFNRDDVIKKLQEAIAKWKSQVQDRQHYLKLKERFAEQTQQMQEQFNELVNSLAREHNLLQKAAARQGRAGIAMLNELPPGLREPISSIEEFRDAMLKILKKA